jgi:hypothetical protein
MATLTREGRSAIKRLVDDLVRGDFAAVAADGRIGRLTLEELKLAVAQYGRTLTRLPEEALDAADIYLTAGSPGRAVVEVDLWTVEEGRSDLTLSVILQERSDGTSISIEDLHVL